MDGSIFELLYKNLINLGCWALVLLLLFYVWGLEDTGLQANLFLWHLYVYDLSITKILLRSRE